MTANEVQIIDNAFSVELAQRLHDTFTSANIPWYHNRYKTYEGANSDLYEQQFTHTLYRNYEPVSSLWAPTIEAFLSIITPLSMIRVKANLTIATAARYYYDWHIDIDHPYTTTAIYYINSNDGVTQFRSGQVVESVANRLVIFPSRLDHRGTSCTDAKTRVLLNWNYLSQA